MLRVKELWHQMWVQQVWLLTFVIQTTCQIPGVIWKEAFVIQGVAQELGQRINAHGSAVVVLVHHIPCLHEFLQRADVSLEPSRDQDHLL